MNKKLIIFFKIIVFLILILYLVSNETIKLDILFNNLFLQYQIILISILLIFISILIGSFRWYLILKIFKFNINYYKVFKITYIGNFFNSLLLGGYGGDALRVYYIYNATNEKKLVLSSTVLIDRIFGLVGLCIIAGYFIFQTNDGINLMYLFLNFIKIDNIFLIILIFTLGLGLFYIFLLQKYNNLKNKIKKFYRYFRRNISMFFILIILSILIFLIVNFVAFLLSKHLLGFELSIDQIFLSNSISNLANAIPLTPGGIGIGEYFFSQTIKIITQNSELFGLANVIILFRLLNIVTSLPSIYYFLIYKNEVIKFK
jgi:glycosyltransferase 2 family protein